MLVEPSLVAGRLQMLPLNWKNRSDDEHVRLTSITCWSGWLIVFFSAKQVPKFCKPDWFALSEATTGLFLDLSIVPSGGIRTTIRGLGWFLDGNAGATKLHGWVQLDEACPNCLWYHQIFEAAWSWDVCSSRMRTKVSCRRVCRKKMSDKTSFS